MNSKQQKFLHMTANNQPGKWRDIGMTNLANTMSVQECETLLDAVQKVEVDRQEKMLVRYTELKAPAVIMNPIQKSLELAKAGTSVPCAILKRRIRKGGE